MGDKIFQSFLKKIAHKFTILDRYNINITSYFFIIFRIMIHIEVGPAVSTEAGLAWIIQAPDLWRLQDR